MPQQATKQLETELETSCCSLGGVRCQFWSVQSSPVQSPGFTETHVVSLLVSRFEQSSKTLSDLLCSLAQLVELALCN